MYSLMNNCISSMNEAGNFKMKDFEAILKIQHSKFSYIYQAWIPEIHVEKDNLRVPTWRW